MLIWTLELSLESVRLRSVSKVRGPPSEPSDPSPSTTTVSASFGMLRGH